MIILRVRPTCVFIIDALLMKAADDGFSRSLVNVFSRDLKVTATVVSDTAVVVVVVVAAAVVVVVVVAVVVVVVVVLLVVVATVVAFVIVEAVVSDVVFVDDETGLAVKDEKNK